jgi:hypothetical protein
MGQRWKMYKLEMPFMLFSAISTRGDEKSLVTAVNRAENYRN